MLLLLQSAGFGANVVTVFSCTPTSRLQFQTTMRHILLYLQLLALAIISGIGAVDAARAQDPTPKRFEILSLNDVYRIEGLVDSDLGGLARVRTVRKKLEEHSDVLVLHAGDLLYPSLVSRTYGGQQMVEVLNLLDGDNAFDDRLLIVFGNHEFDKKDPDDAASLDERIEESRFWWLGTNLDFLKQVVVNEKRRQVVYDGVDSPNILRTYLRQIGGIWVGVFGITMNLPGVSYLESNPLSVASRVDLARRVTAALRERGAEFVIAVTHQPVSADEAVLKLGAAGPDLIIGGHEHSKQDPMVRGRYVLKADADAATVAVVTVELDEIEGFKVKHRFEALNKSVDKDPEVDAKVQEWLSRHAKAFCGKKYNDPTGKCLDKKLAVANVPLVGSELEIRGGETALGDWVAMKMKAAVPNAQFALINSGALRLNQNLPEGTDFTVRHLEELIAYDDALKLVELTGKDLLESLKFSVRCLGSGPWLQMAGIEFDYDPAKRVVENVKVAGSALQPDQSYKGVITGWLSRGKDGYEWLGSARKMQAHDKSLKTVLTLALQSTGQEMDAPAQMSLNKKSIEGEPAEACPID